jgi:hypothetical protein
MLGEDWYLWGDWGIEPPDEQKSSDDPKSE